MRKVETTTEIKANPETIIAAFTDPELLRGWWGVERCIVEPQTGGLYTLAWKITENGFGFVSSGTVTAYQQDKLLVVENMVYLNPERPILGPMALRVLANPTEDGTGTELYLCQDGYQDGPDWDWYYAAVVDAWPKALQTLKKFLEEKNS